MYVTGLLGRRGSMEKRNETSNFYPMREPADKMHHISQQNSALILTKRSKHSLLFSLL
jgi:hypothetical protein